MDMATNYYLRPNDQPDNQIHLGKRMGGWRFIFSGHTGFKTIDDVILFLELQPGEIVNDNNDTEVTNPIEFMAMVGRWQVQNRRSNSIENPEPGAWRDERQFEFLDADFS